MRSYSVTPEEAGLQRAGTEAVQGGSPQENAAAMREVLAGKAGPLREIVLLNAGAALVVAGKAPDLPGGVALAAESIDSGAARRCLERFIQVTQSFA